METKFSFSELYVFSVKDLLELHRTGGGSKRFKEAIHAVILTAIWCIWKCRNELIFDRRTTSSHTIFKEVQSLSLFWVKQRSRWDLLSWEDWMSFSF
ncbi:hypothetical protein R6Q59_029106 [Mikania micrantha]